MDPLDSIQVQFTEYNADSLRQKDRKTFDNITVYVVAIGEEGELEYHEGFDFHPRNGIAYTFMLQGM